MNRTHPLVSLITPTFNQSEYLAETIESVLGQDYPNIEYIVIDDGSTDDTVDLMQRYSTRLKFQSHKNMGQAATLNKGWNQSNGIYIGYLSSDDILYPGAISELVAKLSSNADIVVAYPNCDLINPKSEIVKRNVSRPFDYENLVVHQECYIGPGALFKRSVYERAGGWKTDLRLAPDREFWMRVGKYGRFEMLMGSLAGYRMHPKSISYFEKRPEIALEYIRVLDDFYLDGDLSSRLIAKKNLAYSNAWLVVTRFHLRSGSFRGALASYRKAICYDCANQNARVLFSLFRTSVSKPLRRLHWLLKSLLQRVSF